MNRHTYQISGSLCITLFGNRFPHTRPTVDCGHGVPQSVLLGPSVTIRVRAACEIIMVKRTGSNFSQNGPLIFGQAEPCYVTPGRPLVGRVRIHVSDLTAPHRLYALSELLTGITHVREH